MIVSHGVRMAAPRYETRGITYIGLNQNNTSQTTYTFSGVSIGTASPTRVVVLGIVGSAVTNRTFSSVTIGGVAANVAVLRDNFSTNLGLYFLAVPTGSTADIVVTFSGSESRCVVMVWALKGLQNDNPRATNSNGAGAGTRIISTTLNTTNITQCVGVGISAFNDLATSVFTGLTEDVDAQIGGVISVTGASGSALAASLTIQASWTGGNAIGVNIIGAKFL